MTKRQRKYWEQRMLKQERRMLAYYGSPRLTDGSFMMNAFLMGWLSAQRAQKKVAR